MIVRVPVEFLERLPFFGIGSIADAHRHAKIAVSALGFDDVHTAIESLERALAILGNVKK